MPDVVLHGTFQPSDAKRYRHLPFEVPPGVRALHVVYDYSQRIDASPLLSGGNTLDIGLFDPRGIAPSSPGFRGWSGSHKLAFTVAETWATPPYIAGPIQPGQWHVLLGPYKVAPSGCEYQVAIAFKADPGEPEPRGRTQIHASKPRLPAAEPGWLRGDLHCHTLHSDGDSWPADMLAEAVARGLDFLGVTDHNQTAHHADYASVSGPALPIVLPGIEVTTYGGHWNAWGTSTWWEFRDPGSDATSRVMQLAAASGALVSINHPRPYGPPWEYVDAVGYHAIEVWNGPWPPLNYVALAWWERQLRAGKRVVALGGSDTHTLNGADRPDYLGTPTTWAQVGDEASTEGVLAALRAGRVFVSRDPAGPQLYLTRDVDGVRVRAVDARDSVLMLVSERGIEQAIHVATEDYIQEWPCAEPYTYVRAQLMDAHGEMLALTNAQFDHT